MSTSAQHPVDLYAPWSPSKSDSAAKCPLAFKKQYIDKLPRVTGSAARTGTVAHRVQELILQDVAPREALERALGENSNDAREDERLTTREAETVASLLPALISFSNRIADFGKRKKITAVYAEQKLGIRKDFSPCDFFDQDVFFRGVIDYLIILESGYGVIIDHKSGRVRPVSYYEKQLDAYAVLVRSHYPHLKGTQGALHYMAAETIEWSVMRHTAIVDSMLRPHLLDGLRRRAEGLAGFQPRLSKLCGWCDHRGTCDAYLQSDFNKTKKKSA